jgi:D-amino peptidase
MVSIAPRRLVADIRSKVEEALSDDLKACTLALASNSELVVEFATPVDAYRVG